MSQSMRWLLIWAVGLCAFSSEGEATKCPYASYVVEGRVVGSAAGSSGGLRIYLFLEGSRLTSDYPPKSSEEEYVIPDAEGLFEIEAKLNTEKSGRCGRFVESGHLFIVGEGVRAFRTQVAFKDAKRSARKGLVVRASDVRVTLVPRL